MSQLHHFSGLLVLSYTTNENKLTFSKIFLYRFYFFLAVKKNLKCNNFSAGF